MIQNKYMFIKKRNDVGIEFIIINLEFTFIFLRKTSD